MRVMVTGADGYIGKHVVKALLDLGVSVSAVDLHINAVDDKAEHYAMNIFDEGINFYELTKCPDIIVHLAWKDGFIHNSSSHIKHLSEHIGFCERAVNYGVKKLLCMGSVHEIGYYVGKVDETTPCEPRCFYGIAKNALRQALFAIPEQETCFLWIRAFSVYGDDENSHSIFSKILESEKQGQNNFPLNSGNNYGDFIHVEQLATQIAMCSLYAEKSGIYQCCSGKPVSFRMMVEKFISDNKLTIRPQYGVYPERLYDSKKIYGDNSKVQNIMKGKTNDIQERN